MLNGIDVSNNNGPIDWIAVKRSGLVDFALMKVSQGTSFVDPYVRGWWSLTGEQGIKRGGYHFAVPSQNHAADEAQHFLDSVGSFRQPGDVLALDLERYQDNLEGVDVGSWALDWLQTVYRAIGVRPWFYCSPSFVNEQRLADYQGLGEYGLWLASWGLSKMPAAPAPWPFLACWQVSNLGNVPGIAGNVDVDAFNGSSDQWRAYGTPEAAGGGGTGPILDPLADARARLAAYVNALRVAADGLEKLLPPPA